MNRKLAVFLVLVLGLSHSCNKPTSTNQEHSKQGAWYRLDTGPDSSNDGFYFVYDTIRIANNDRFVSATIIFSSDTIIWSRAKGFLLAESDTTFSIIKDSICIDSLHPNSFVELNPRVGSSDYMVLGDTMFQYWAGWHPLMVKEQQ